MVSNRIGTINFKDPFSSKGGTGKGEANSTIFLAALSKKP